MPIRPVPPDRLPGRENAGRGLTAGEAAARRERFGANDIVVAPPSNWLGSLGDTLRDPMIWFLIIVSVLFVAIGDYTEAAVLVVAVAPLVGMDLYLHRRTQASTQGLASRLRNDIDAFRIHAKVAPSVRPGEVIIYHAWENHQFRGDKGFQNLIPSPINPVELAGGQFHLRPMFICLQPAQSDRDTRVEVAKVA